MKVEILTLCDYAQAYGDRLTIVGAFSTINAEKFPINMSDVTLVVKIVLDENDNKKHDISVLIKKESDSEPIVVQYQHLWTCQKVREISSPLILY